jgi:predicted ester cyclase
MSPAGRDASKRGFALGLKQLVDAFPDLVTKVEDMVVDEKAQRVAVRWSSVGTNRLCFLGTGPTNRKTLITGIEIIEISEGRITRRWGEWDITAHQTSA